MLIGSGTCQSLDCAEQSDQKNLTYNKITEEKKEILSTQACDKNHIYHLLRFLENIDCNTKQYEENVMIFDYIVSYAGFFMYHLMMDKKWVTRDLNFYCTYTICNGISKEDEAEYYKAAAALIDYEYDWSWDKEKDLAKFFK